MSKFNKKRFIKYRLMPLVLFSLATIMYAFFAFVIMDAKTIPINIGLLIIMTLITLWAVVIDSNNDAHAREIKDILNKRLPELDEEKNE